MLPKLVSKLHSGFFFLFFALIVSFTSSPFTHAKFGAGLEEEAMNQLKTAMKTDPGAVIRNEQVLKKLSASQISYLMEYLDTTHYTYLHVVTIKGEELSAKVMGNGNNQLSVMVTHGGKLQPIPFQIDEVDITGLTFIPEVRRYKIDGTEGVFDKQDEVAFMYRDASNERYQKGKTQLSRGEVLKEIVLTFQDRKPRYAYLVKGNSQRHDAVYVDFNIERGNFNSTYFSMSWDPANFSQMRNIIPKVGPEQGKNIIDNIYFEVGTGIFNKNVRFGLNSQEHIFASIEGVKKGPIRITALIKGQVKYAGIPSMPYYLNMLFTEQSLSFRSRSTPDGYKYAKYVTTVLKEPKLYVSIDFHNIDGAKINFHSINEAGKGGFVDGKMSSLEHMINDKRLPGDWFWIESGLGWSIFFSNNLPIVENGLFDAFLEGMTFHMIYEDDLTKTTSYERFPGGEPRIGVSGGGLPKIALEMMSALSSIPWEDTQSMGDMGRFLIEGSASGKLGDLNNIISGVLVSEREKGKLRNNDDLADAFIADFNLVGIRGVDRVKLNKAFRIGISKIESFETFDIGKLVKDIQVASKELGIDASLIHYAPRDNVLWLPDSMGEGGPDAFRQEVQNPPAVHIKDVEI